MTTVDALIRQEKLASKVRGLRVRRANLGLHDRWMLIVGGTLVPLGLVIVLLGWFGASRTPLVFEQIPYLISGGVLGLSMVFAGGFVYFAYWMTLLVRENRGLREDLVGVLGRMETLLQAPAQPTPTPTPAPRVRAGSSPTAPAVTVEGLVATKTGSMMHRSSCDTVQNRAGLRQVSVATKGLTACRLCDPLDQG